MFRYYLMPGWRSLRRDSVLKSLTALITSAGVAGGVLLAIGLDQLFVSGSNWPACLRCMSWLALPSSGCWMQLPYMDPRGVPPAALA